MTGAGVAGHHHHKHHHHGGAHHSHHGGHQHQHGGHSHHGHGHSHGHVDMTTPAFHPQATAALAGALPMAPITSARSEPRMISTMSPIAIPMPAPPPKISGSGNGGGAAVAATEPVETSASELLINIESQSLQ